MIYTKDELVTAIVSTIPYPNHISNWDISSVECAIIFTWRNDVFHISTSEGVVHECKDGFIAGSNIAILLEHLIKTTLIERQLNRLKDGK